LPNENNTYKYYIFSEKPYSIGCKNGSGETVKLIHDITVSKEKAENLVTLLNKHEVSPVHFKDVVEDELI